MIQTPPPIPEIPAPPFDPNLALNTIMPLAAVLVGVVVCGMVLRWLFRTPVGEAIADRIRGRGAAGRQALADHAHAELESRVTFLQDQVAELGERLDFAERLLAERRDQRLPPGR